MTTHTDVKSDKGQIGSNTIPGRFQKWLAESFGNGKPQHRVFFAFVKESDLSIDTVTRWRNGKQIPTVESVEKAVRAYAFHLAETEGLKGKEAVSRAEEHAMDILVGLIGADGKIAEMQKALKKAEKIIRERNANNSTKLNVKKRAKR